MPLPSPIAVIGASGQVGRALCNELGTRAIPITRNECNLSAPTLAMDWLHHVQPSLVINAAAYTQVDDAEQNPSEAWRINASAVGELAEMCKAHHLPFIHCSTDYVFDGKRSKPWNEDRSPHPLNIYGTTKRAGEEALMAVGGEYLIFRLAWVYDHVGNNFLTKILKRAQSQPEITVVQDQTGQPSYAPDIAKAMLSAVDQACQMSSFPSGIYHLAPELCTTRYDFAQAILEQAVAAGLLPHMPRMLAAESKDFPQAAARPLYSVLDVSKLKKTFGIQLPHWQEALKQAIKRVQHPPLPCGERVGVRGKKSGEGQKVW